MKALQNFKLFTALCLSVIVTLYTVCANAGHPSKFEPPILQQAWQIEGIDTPESVIEVHKGHESYFLVSAIEGDFFTKDGVGSIVKISPKGDILQRDWISGLNAPKGMAISRGKLYVADLDEIVVADVATATIIKRIPVPNAIFLNDVAADNRGNVYASDTFTGIVYRLGRDGLVVEHLSGLTSPNGLLIDHKALLVGAGSELLAFNQSKQSSVLANGFPHDIDGIAKWGCRGYFVSAWDGLVYAVSPNGEKSLLIDSVDQGIRTADLTYSDHHNLLLVPNFFSNTVTAYKVKSPKKSKD